MSSDRDLKRKIGQLFMFGFQGTEPSDALKKFLDEWGLGGVIVFTRNAADGDGMQRLVKKIRDASPAPLLLSIDHEGGPVLRLSRGVSQLPSAMGLAAAGSPERARLAGQIAGAELAALGIDVNLAPVFDVNSNRDNPGIGLRSFGESPEQVGRFAIPYMEGLQSTGVSATAKHYPGKGSASLDAHFDLPFISRGLEDLRRIDFPPFVEAIRKGVDCVMGSHTVYGAFGDDVPGTLSPRVMTELLRSEMGFGGVLITDDLEMGAIRDHFGFDRAIKSSFTAGADQLLICHDPLKQEHALRLMEEAVRSGEIDEDQVDRSVERVRRLQAKHQSRRSAPQGASLAELVRIHKPEVERMLRDSICLVQDPGRLLPRRRGSGALAIFPVLAELSPVEEKTGDDPALIETLQGALPELHALRFTPKQPGPVDEACRLARQSEVTIFFSYNAHVDPAQTDLLERVRDASQAFVLIALRNPYDLRLARAADTTIASLGFRPRVLQIVAGLLLGTDKVTGKLPATV